MRNVELLIKVIDQINPRIHSIDATPTRTDKSTAIIGVLQDDKPIELKMTLDSNQPLESSMAQLILNYSGKRVDTFVSTKDSQQSVLDILEVLKTHDLIEPNDQTDNENIYVEHGLLSSILLTTLGRGIMDFNIGKGVATLYPTGSKTLWVIELTYSIQNGNIERFTFNVPSMNYRIARANLKPIGVTTILDGVIDTLNSVIDSKGIYHATRRATK